MVARAIRLAETIVDSPGYRSSDSLSSTPPFEADAAATAATGLSASAIGSVAANEADEAAELRASAGNRGAPPTESLAAVLTRHVSSIMAERLGSSIDGAPNGGARAAPPKARLSAHERALAAAATAARLMPDLGSLTLNFDRTARGALYRWPRKPSELLPVHVPPSEPGGGVRARDGDAHAEGARGERKPSLFDPLATALRSPSAGACFVALGAWGANSRYSQNIYHQAEYVLPMVETAVSRGKAPGAVLWPWALLPWSRQLLGTLLPSTRILEGKAARDAQPALCTRESTPFKAVGTGGGKRGYWKKPSAPSQVRRLVLRACGLPLRVRPRAVRSRQGPRRPCVAQFGSRPSPFPSPPSHPSSSAAAAARRCGACAIAAV